jgi:hypothetical protein
MITYRIGKVVFVGRIHTKRAIGMSAAETIDTFGASPTGGMSGKLYLSGRHCR